MTREPQKGGREAEALSKRLKQAFPQIIAVSLFGSRGTEHEREASDLDLAVYAKKPLRAAELWLTAQELASEIGRDVDVVDLASASPVMRAQVVHTGERLCCDDPVACETFEDHVYASYARLNEERRGILEDVLRRGSVYG